MAEGGDVVEYPAIGTPEKSVFSTTI